MKKSSLAVAFLLSTTALYPAKAALWTDPALLCVPSPGSIYCPPAITPPSLTGDLVGWRLQNPTGSSIPAGYVTYGAVFLKGTVQKTDTLVARITGTSYYVQMDWQTAWDDGSVKHAALTFKTPAAIAAGATVDAMIAVGPHTGSAAAPSPAAPTATALLGTGYDATAAFTWHAGGAGSETKHANACLTGAATATNLVGAAVNEYHVTCTAGGGLLKVEYDIRAYADGSTQTDIIFDNSWFLSGGKTNALNYDITISDGFTASAVPQWLYTRWHHTINSVASLDTGKLNVQYDVPYLIATKVLPNYDFTWGVTNAALNGAPGNATDCRWQCLQDTPSRTAPMTGVATQGSDQTTAGAREDIGVQPNWVVTWLHSQDFRPRYVMMANADVQGSWPMHITDEATGQAVDITWSGNPTPWDILSLSNPTYDTSVVYPNCTQPSRCHYPSIPPQGVMYPGLLFFAGAETGNAGPAFANGTPTKIGPSPSPWSLDVSHVPNVSFVPYLITVSHYYLENMQDQAFNAASMGAAKGVDASQDPTDLYGFLFWAGNGLLAPRSTNIKLRELRAVAWSMRDIAETAAFTPDADPLKNSFLWLLGTPIHGAQQVYVQKAALAIQGQTIGSIPLSVPNLSHTGEEDGLQTGYYRETLSILARMEVNSQLTSDAIDLLNLAGNRLSGWATSGDMGFNPFTGPTYWHHIYSIPAGNVAATWGSYMQVGQFDNNDMGTYGLGNPTEFHDNICCPQEFTNNVLNSYPILQGIGEAANISLDPTNIQAWRAFAYDKAWIADHMAQIGKDIVNGDGGNNWRSFPKDLIAPNMPNGLSLYEGNSVINVSSGAQGTITPPNSALPSLLAATEASSITMNGGNGGNIFLGPPAGTAVLNAGTGNDIMLAAWNASGQTTFNDNVGNNTMYGTPAGTGANVFSFTVASSGQDTIWNFRPGTDTLKVKQNLNGNFIMTDVQLIAAGTTNAAGDGVVNLGGGNTVTIRRVPPASWAGSITMVP